MTDNNFSWTPEYCKNNIEKLPKEAEIIYFDKNTKKIIKSITLWQDREHLEDSPHMEFYLDGNISVLAMKNKNGINKRKQSFYPDGKIHSYVAYKEGEQDGVDMEFYPNGQLLRKDFFEKGKPVLQSLIYHPNGMIFLTSSYSEKGDRVDIKMLDTSGIQLNKKPFYLNSKYFNLLLSLVFGTFLLAFLL